MSPLEIRVLDRLYGAKDPLAWEALLDLADAPSLDLFATLAELQDKGLVAVEERQVSERLAVKAYSVAAERRVEEILGLAVGTPGVLFRPSGLAFV